MTVHLAHMSGKSLEQRTQKFLAFRAALLKDVEELDTEIAHMQHEKVRRRVIADDQIRGMLQVHADREAV